jgi:hypothetical protein
VGLCLVSCFSQYHPPTERNCYENWSPELKEGGSSPAGDDDDASGGGGGEEEEEEEEEEDGVGKEGVKEGSEGGGGYPGEGNSFFKEADQESDDYDTE